MHNKTNLLMIMVLGLLIFSTQAAVTGLKVTFRAGKSYITWTQEANSGKSYNIYRSKSIITSVKGLIPLVNIKDSSSYDKRYQLYHVITDTGRPLTDSNGLFVYTPKEREIAYYAVTVLNGSTEDTAITAGVNSLTGGVSEEYWKHPLGVLRELPFQTSCTTCKGYYFFLWMDYFDWPNKRDYYGDWYYVVYHPDIIGKKNLPVHTYLHGWAGKNTPGISSLPSIQAESGVIRLCVRDLYIQPEGHDWWYGVSNHYGEHALRKGDTIVNYSEMRLVACLNAMANDTRFSIDTNRIYLSGGSMGGLSTANVAFHFPDLFAACMPYIAFYSVADRQNASDLVSWNFPLFYGNYTLGLTARNGVNIYKWNNPAWLLRNYVSRDLPPVLNYHGTADGTCPPYWHANFLQAMNESRHAVWGKWLVAGHTMAGGWTSAVSGDFYRFRKDELYPAFTNATKNDDYGRVDSVTEYGAPYMPKNFTLDSVGMVNSYIDWTSSRHKMGLANDSLIDCSDSIVITFKSDSIGTKADITPRRIQHFKVVAGNIYSWTNRALATGSLIDSGKITADSFGLITVAQFVISTTGNRLVLKNIKSSPTETVFLSSGKLQLRSFPNPSNGVVTFRIAGASSSSRITIFDTNGRVVFSLKEKDFNIPGFNWSGVDNGGNKVPVGLYIVELKDNKHKVSTVVNVIR